MELMGIPDEAIVSLVSKLAVMKPNKAKKNDLKAVAKLEALLLSNDYDAEEKIDGCHYLMVACRFFSSDHVEKTDNYPHIRDFFIKLGMPNLILDGEIFYPGKTSQYCTHVTGADPSTAIAFQDKNGYIHYYFWDMLRTPKGTWLLTEPYYKRRAILEHFYNNFIANTPMAEYIHISRKAEGDKLKFKDEILENGGEGVVLKKKNSLYVMGKKPAWMWMKIKTHDTADLFISGFEPAKQETSTKDFDNWPYWREIGGENVPVSKFYYMGWIGAMELSAYINGKATKICTCAGFNEDIRKKISDNPNAYLNKVIKVSYMESTEAGYPRHPVFEGFHESKLASECEWAFEE